MDYEKAFELLKEISENENYKRKHNFTYNSELNEYDSYFTFLLSIEFIEPHLSLHNVFILTKKGNKALKKGNLKESQKLHKEHNKSTKIKNTTINYNHSNVIQDSNFVNSPTNINTIPAPNKNEPKSILERLWKLMDHKIVIYILTAIIGLILTYFGCVSV